MLSSLLLLVLTLACGDGGAAGRQAQTAQPASDPAADAALDLALRDIFEAMKPLDPEMATASGDERFRGHMTLTLRHSDRQARSQVLQDGLERLGEIDPDRLSPTKRLYQQAVLFSLESELDLLDFPDHLLPLHPLEGLSNRFLRAASGSGDLTFLSREDFQHLISRSDDLAAWAQQAEENLRQGIQLQIVHPKSIVQIMLMELDEQLSDPVEDGPFGFPLRALEALPEAERGEIDHATLRASLEGKALPALRRLRDFLRAEYLPASRDTLGLSHLGRGTEWYAAMARLYSTTDLSPDDLFDLGSKEVSRIQDELRALAKSSGHGNLEALDAAMAEAAEAPREEALLARLEALRAQVESQLSGLFGHLPTSPLEIRPVEAERARTTGAAFYERPAVDGSRPGIFYINLQLGGFDLTAAEALFLHEALPGHHLQMAIAQEREDLPDLLRFGFFGAFIEGWGLYSEALGEELGLYQEAEQRYGRLRLELLRACRLLGDVGIHHLGWSQDVADRYLRGRGLSWASAEILGWTARPGQAISYKVGELHFWRLRRQAEEALGREFDLAAFHDLLLAHGPLPLAVLQAEVDRWITESS